MMLVAIAGIGLCFGSFVNALVWRLHMQQQIKTPKQKATFSIAHGRSQCIHCGHQLAATDLVPLLSWLSLRGKCRYCRRPISWQYPAVELLTAALFVASYAWWPYQFDASGVLRLVVWLAVLTGLVALVVYDLRWMLLPNRIVYPLIGLVLAHVVVQATLAGQSAGQVLSGAFWGFICVGGVFYGLFQLSKGKWIGGGDVKLGFLLGLIVGAPVPGLLVLFGASLLGTLTILPLLLSGRATRRTRIPFGPFLVAAAIIVQLFGQTVIEWYKRQFLLI